MVAPRPPPLPHTHSPTQTHTLRQCMYLHVFINIYRVVSCECAPLAFKRAMCAQTNLHVASDWAVHSCALLCISLVFHRLRLVSASVRTGLGRGPRRGASRDGPRLPYDVTVYGISIERPICYLRIAWDRYLIYNKELFCSVLFYNVYEYLRNELHFRRFMAVRTAVGRVQSASDPLQFIQP